MLPRAETLPLDVEQNRAEARFISVLKYVLRHLLAVVLTILIGVFITVVIANHTGMLDKAIRLQINQELISRSLDQYIQGDLDEQRQQLETTSGLSLSFWPKHLLYTIRALQLDWGNVLDRRKFNTWVMTPAGPVSTYDSRSIILGKLPNTLLLSGTAFLLLTLLGIPIALYLSQHEGQWLDRIFGILTPLSSIPSWVIGILLVLVFAVQLRLFPAGKMFDSIPPRNAFDTVWVVSRHLFLPVFSILLSLIFQLVYSWRTYLLIYSAEDYLILAKAKGLKKQAIDLHYVLKPALPYMFTSLAITLVGFWQMTTALEFFFQWPGIGKLFVDALPNFHSEAMYPGEMSIVVGLVVVFAYLLGITVFLLEISYLLLDPRIQAKAREGSVSLVQKQKSRGWRERMRRLLIRPTYHTPQLHYPQPGQMRTQPVERYRSFMMGLKYALFTTIRDAKTTLHNISEVSSGKAGLVLLSMLVVVAILVLVLIPYNPVAKEWSGSGLVEKPTVAKFALPIWVNWFRASDLPPTIVLDGQKNHTQTQAFSPASGTSKVQMDFVFEYPYEVFPNDLALYLTASYQEKMPFVSLTWITPDGREIELKSGAVTNNFTYAFRENVPVKRLIRTSDLLKKWFVVSGSQQTPEFYILFADPNAGEPVVMKGEYTLRVNATLFEEDSTIDGQLVIFGLVEGWAGTDYLRRDLRIPLLWGLPFALFVGVLGSFTTSLIALILAAASAWMGGWVDYLLQRATEINLILPVLVVSVLLYSFYQLSFWVIVGIIILSTVLGSSVKSFRAAFIQEKTAGYIEAAVAYGASDWRIILHYLVRRIVPIMIPQMILLIPNFIFLEATLAIFNISDVRYPTWGRMLYSALRYGDLYGSKFWVLGPIALMLITGLTFVLIGTALNRILTPHLER